MKIALAQLDTTIGDLAGNARLVLEACAEASAQGATLIVLSELVVTGYPPRDLLNVGEFRAACDAAVESIVRELPPGLFAIFGAPRSRPRDGCPAAPGTFDRGGRALWNTAIVAERGRIVAEVPKALLPTYDVFDERRYFEPAPEQMARVFELAGKRVGVTICEDMWNDRLFWGEDRLYDRDPVAEAVEQGAELVVNVSASPFAQHKFDVRRRMVSHAARRWRVPVVYVNAVGGNDGLLFDGHSHAFAEDGEPIVELPFFERAVRTIELGERTTLPRVDELEVLNRALVTGVRDYARKTGMSRWVLGLSGGIDSALVAAIGSLALGAENGAALAMPSRYSSEHSLEDARTLATKLKLPFETIPIEPAHAAYETMLTAPLDRHPLPDGDVTWENVQARIRGATLMAWANRTGALLLTTGNKSECAVGYCTLYGDTCGGLAVIADLFKVEVYALSRRINELAIVAGKVPPIPESTLTKAPSAELRPNQTDQDDLPPYEVLDRVLDALIVRELGVEDAAKLTQDPLELVRNIARRVRTNEYKRQQFPPTLRVSDRAWVGREYPIAQRFFE